MTKDHLHRTMRHLGWYCEDPYEKGLLFEAVAVRKAILAYDVESHDTVETPQGNIRPKTKKQQQIEWAVSDSLMRLLADMPDHSYGSTAVSVRNHIAEAYAKAAQDMAAQR